ncbi:hypothetical protein A3D06_00500 [Candidatus Roizmanbacteria bacterium RIFCSPHIGHO2_02_FULL_40_9]|uniref:EamA domain-containing protein n=2 Tax=Candidatus Roizmaniibacteriota TaxID=1752723 RepID=A0A1F7IPE4_9BACT|nr:MAG: hypothetical protein A3D06_00500 [Candidatus Roizmanbacteria bacterium RIFCSPHIGHO2_02_FULL_40_9]OGK45250.1 MAG: hypothetical protein A2957_01405 [Candidatus Roizmanbacteria bacterium RIFCSPLOWO2_01_FULL_38_11]
MKKKLTHIGPLFIAAAAILWSLDGLLRVALYSLPPAVIIFWEHFLGALILSPFIFIKRKEIKHLTRKEWMSILFVSLFSGVLGTMLYTAALGKINYIQFSVVALLQQLQPIWAITTATILLKEKLDKKFVQWAGLAIIASYFVTFKDMRVNISSSNETLIAALFALLAGVVWAVSTSFSKIVLNKVSFQLTTLLRFLIAPIFALVFIFIFHNQNAMLAINQDQWLKLLTITLSTGMVALLIYYYGLRNTPAKVSAIVELLWPASAIAIDYFFFHKMLSLTQIVGTVVLLFSIFKVSKFYK